VVGKDNVVRRFIRVQSRALGDCMAQQGLRESPEHGQYRAIQRDFYAFAGRQIE